MQTFVMFGRYTVEAVRTISAERTTKALEILKRHGGELRSSHVLLGSPDMVVIVDLPGIREATSVSVALTKATGISFTTAAAMPMDEFDKLAAKA